MWWPTVGIPTPNPPSALNRSPEFGHNLAKLDSGWWAGVQRRQKVDCQETCMQLSWPSKQINLTLFMQGQRFQYGCHNHNRLSALFSVLCISKEWSTDEDNSVLRFSTTEDFFSLSKRWKVGNFSPTIPPLMYVYIWSYVSHILCRVFDIWFT